MSSIYLSREFI